ncbi:hypothetical protein N7492_001351 [Penicillium capsulatum]|uniref:Uncharacterized protein n=1 Tax=Penicillium capsulatum TaxID=69766 RepID=A0A9W9IVF0_9EURO|nr:hypothetical protein N7492_001351 [Penicillium capsulatum]KAJ6129590.1 hypothetical protein N7512_002370 [Penicillium capsulatum]
MTYFRDAYQKFLVNPRSAPLAADVSLYYVASSTTFEGADAVSTHASRHASVVKKSEQTINVIESADSLVLDQETTLDFIDGGGVYLPTLDDSLIANNVVTIPTLHIVHFNAQSEIQQVRIYWDQGVLLKVVGVIGKRNWPLGDAKEQIRVLKGAATAKSNPPPLAPSNDAVRELPACPGSPGKKHIKDPYAADSLFDLLSPSKEEAANGDDERPRASSPGKRYTKDPYAADSLADLLSPSKEEAANGRDERPRSSSQGKRYTKDPYAADSLTELLSPSKSDATVVRPYAPSAKQPASRSYGDLFVDPEEPSTPSKPEKPIAPKGGHKVESSQIFNYDLTEGQDRVPYKSNPRRFDHFEIGGDDDEFTTPQKPSRCATAEQQSQFVYGEDDGDAESPPARPHVPKPRRDAEVHFEVKDELPDEDDGRIISAYQNRGQALYNNRLFDDNGEAVPTEKEVKQRPLSVVGHEANRRKDFDPHWQMVEGTPEPKKSDTENAKVVPQDRAQTVKMLESQWELHDELSKPVRTATSLWDPRRHNQPSWTLGDEE